LDKRHDIIIIEDHPVMRTGLVSFFSKTGRWNILGIAASVSNAKKILAKTKTDVLLIDIKLEDGWGLDLIPWLKENIKQGEPLPVLAVYTAFDDYAHVSAALSLGIKTYITKSSSENELEAALLKALKGETYIDEGAKMHLQNVTALSSLLTKREGQLLQLIKQGLSNKEAADKLGISPRTVANILSCVYAKTGIKSRKELERL